MLTKTKGDVAMIMSEQISGRIRIVFDCDCETTIVWNHDSDCGDSVTIDNYVPCSKHINLPFSSLNWEKILNKIFDEYREKRVCSDYYTLFKEFDELYVYELGKYM